MELNLTVQVRLERRRSVLRVIMERIQTISRYKGISYLRSISLDSMCGFMTGFQTRFKEQLSNYLSFLLNRKPVQSSAENLRSIVQIRRGHLDRVREFRPNEHESGVGFPPPSVSRSPHRTTLQPTGAPAHICCIQVLSGQMVITGC